MHVQKIKLFHFRNLLDQEIELSPRLNFFVGQNGQGKTNLVEAIYFASLGRSFRTSKAADLVSWGEKEASVFVRVALVEDEIELGVAIERGKKQPYVAGEKVSTLADYMGRLVCVGFSPSDLELVRGGPAERRRFLDRHLSELKPQLVEAYVSYHKALKTKNKLLITGQLNKPGLETWNLLLARYALPILRERRVFVEELCRAAGPLHKDFCGSDGQLELRLKSTVENEIVDAGEEALFASFMHNSEREIRVKKTVAGPHRDELVVHLAGKEARSFASQGQTRSIVLALKLAVIHILEQKLGDSPVVLLDDVESELDARRKGLLFELVFTQGRQVLVTGTDTFEAQKRDREYASFGVSEGNITTLSD